MSERFSAGISRVGDSNGATHDKPLHTLERTSYRIGPTNHAGVTLVTRQQFESLNLFGVKPSKVLDMRYANNL